MIQENSWALDPALGGLAPVLIIAIFAIGTNLMA
jgi:hypothetical protein